MLQELRELNFLDLVLLLIILVIKLLQKQLMPLQVLLRLVLYLSSLIIRFMKIGSVTLLFRNQFM